MEKITSPDNAIAEVSQELYDAAIPNGAIALTVHEAEGTLIGNVWMREGNTYTKLLPERAGEAVEGSTAKPNPTIFLQGEMNRWMFANQDNEDDIRVRLTLTALWAKIKRLQDAATTNH